MIINEIVYDERGQLVPPTERDIRRAQLLTNPLDMMDFGQADPRLDVTLEPGHVHLYKFNVSGQTREEVTAKAEARLTRLLDRIEFERGYRKITINRNKGRTTDGRLYLALDVIYAIEKDRPTRPRATTAPRARRHVADSQYRVRGGQYRLATTSTIADPIWFE